jgi:hypothetical protein
MFLVLLAGLCMNPLGHANTPCNNQAAVMTTGPIGPQCVPKPGEFSSCNDVQTCADPPGVYPQLQCPLYLYYNVTAATTGKKFGCGGTTPGVCCRLQGAATIKLYNRPDACDCNDCADSVTACANVCCPNNTQDVLLVTLRESQTAGCSWVIPPGDPPPPGQWQCDAW